MNIFILILLLLILFLLTIELLFGYQMICYLFYNDQDIYIKAINYQPLKNEVFIITMASIGIILSLLFMIVIYYKISASSASSASLVSPEFDETGQVASTNYMVYIPLIVLIIASFGINIWLIIIYNQIIAGEKNIRNIQNNDTYNLLQKLIPSSIGIFLIQFMIILYYIILINHT
jgi:hypothetical protein